MRLAIIGGGGFRVPLVYRAVVAASLGIDEIVLYDEVPERTERIRSVLRAMGSEPGAPRVRVEHDLAGAVRGADAVFLAIRVGGTRGRVLDERVALARGLIGQETVGAGGLAFALRTVPVVRRIARVVKETAPEAWVVNFTNPAGIVTQVLQEELGTRVVGICDTPAGLVMRSLEWAGEVERDPLIDYVGINHLGWLRGLRVDGRDVLAAILGSDDALSEIEEARLIGADWVRALGALPNEYLAYYYRRDDVFERIRARGRTRGELLDEQQSAFFSADVAEGTDALRHWERARRQRDESYMAEARDASETRRAGDVDGGGYHTIAVRLLEALLAGRPATLILNVRNDRLIPALAPHVVVEVPCRVGRDAIEPLPVASVGGEMLGLLTAVKAAEDLIVAAAGEGSRDLAWRAFAAHPLVGSIATARALVDEYRAHVPQLGELLR